MSVMPTTFARYRETTVKEQPYSNRKMCAHCKEGRPLLGGQQMPRPGSARRDWVCQDCKNKIRGMP